MKNSLFSSIAVFCLLTTSCASFIRSGCGQTETVPLARTDIPPVIAATDSLQTFDVEISFFGRRLNGMLLAKRQDPGAVRILINSYFGMSMADFELRPDTFAVHYLLDAMHKPAVVNLFKNDFELLFGFHLPERFTARKSVCGYPEKLLAVETENGTIRYRINSENQCITKIQAPGIRIDIEHGAFPRTIVLKHRGIFKPSIVMKEME